MKLQLACLNVANAPLQQPLERGKRPAPVCSLLPCAHCTRHERTLTDDVLHEAAARPASYARQQLQRVISGAMELP
jgi:hypothetical protein